jgi:hypothetical protein
MNPKVGIYFTLVCSVLVVALSSCNSSSSPAVAPSPTPCASTGADTLYVQTSAASSSGQVRVYKHASVLNGSCPAAVVLPTSDISNPDLVYSSLFQVLWYPSAYPQSSGGGTFSTPIRIWNDPLAENGMNPNVVVKFQNGQGTAAYDSNHDLLFVSNVNNSAVQVFANAHAMTSSSTPAANVTLTITDNTVVGAPRAVEMLYDAVNDRLYASDFGAVVAVFDNFGAQAQTAVTTSTNPTIPASREISGLFFPYGMAYSLAADKLFVAEQKKSGSNILGQIDIVKNASTANGPNTHSQVVNGFTSGPSGLAYDSVRDLLFAYDGTIIWVIPNPSVATGNVNSIVNRRFFTDPVAPLSGFGIAVDTTQ